MKPTTVLWAHWHSPGIVKQIWRATVQEIRMDFYAHEMFFGMTPQTVRIEIDPQGPVIDPRFAPRTDYVQFQFERVCTETVRYRPALPWAKVIGNLYIPKPALPLSSPSTLLLAISGGPNPQEAPTRSRFSRKFKRSNAVDQLPLFDIASHT
jgi:hypothetical protein